MLAGSARSDAGLVCVPYGSSTLNTPRWTGDCSVLRVRAARGPAASRARPADRADRPSWDRNREDARLNLKTRPRWIFYDRGHTLLTIRYRAILIPFSAVASHTQSQICWSEYHQTHGDGFAHVTRRDERVPRARRAPAEHALEVRPFSHDTEPL